jgi:hypothetical protein
MAEKGVAKRGVPKNKIVYQEDGSKISFVDTVQRGAIGQSLTTMPHITCKLEA